MDVYQKALKNPDPPKKPGSHSKTPLVDSEHKVSFVPGVPSISQLHQEPRLLQPTQPLPALVLLQQHFAAVTSSFPIQQPAFPPLLQFVSQIIPSQYTQQQPLQIPNQGNMSLNHTQTPNSSVTKIHQTRSPVLPNTREQRQQQEQGQEQQYAQLKQEFFSSKRKRNSRRKHRNSHLGCGTCKKRRIKCDETLPSCLNCIKGKLHCAYLNLDNQARNALRLAQYNQSMRQERLEGGKTADAQQQQQQLVSVGALLAQQQAQNGPVLASVGNAPAPHPTIMTNNGGFIPMQQQMGQGASLPSTAVMQSPYGPISLVPVLTNTGAVVYAPTSALPGPVPVSQQPTPAPQMPILTNTSQQLLSQPSLPLPQQQTPSSIRARAPSILSASSMGQESQTTLSVSPTQRQLHQKLPSLTPITSTAANAATLASQNIQIKPQHQEQPSSNAEIKLPPLAPISVPSISVSKSNSTSVSPSLKSDSESVQALRSAPVLSPISMTNVGAKEDKSTLPASQPEKSPALPSISHITQQPSMNSIPTSPDLKQQQKEEQKEEQHRREERDRVYSRSEVNTASHSRSRSRSPTRSRSRTASPQSITSNVAATIVDAPSSHLIPKLGSVSNFGSLSIKEEDSKNGELKLPKTGVDSAVVAATNSTNGSKEEKVSISKLIT